MLPALKARSRLFLVHTFDWLRKKCECFRPITKRSNVQPKQIRITFDTQVKTALFGGIAIQMNKYINKCKNEREDDREIKTTKMTNTRA